MLKIPFVCSRVAGLQVVKVLAEAGADLNLPENRGWTALMIAASRGCVESIEALLGEQGSVCMLIQEVHNTLALSHQGCGMLA
jgi:ankyrin repeat protein